MRPDTQRTVMIMERDCRIRSIILQSLQENGFRFLIVDDIDEAIYQAEAHKPDLIIVDFDSTDSDRGGLYLCRGVRALGLAMPMIFLASRTPIENLDAGLRIAGPGSDFMRKVGELGPSEPSNTGEHKSSWVSSIHELMVRIRARLPQESRLIGSQIQIDQRRHVVERLVDSRWENLRLQPLQYDVFRYLAEANGALVGTWELFEQVFQVNEGPYEEPDQYRNRVWSCISALRRRLDPIDQARYIETVHGLGYRLRMNEP
ncbi:MAG: winged helix-turn-helix domain-containing protein [SAR202 cluster bacterium]|nr:winged helix-turn-helix domain-containing protein [SAR202 cluster bacterium]